MGEYIASPIEGAKERYHIGSAIREHAAHHESFQALWETKWKKPCMMGVYPFMFGCVKDFEPVVERLIAKDMREPYDWDAYAQEFFPDAEALVTAANKAEEVGEKDRAFEYLLRASALYRIARFPIPRSAKQKLAWSKGKEVFLRGQSLLPHPVVQITVPHRHGLSHEGSEIPIFHLLPSFAFATSPVPTVIIYTGLDGYRTELAVWAEGFRSIGVGIIIFEIPGTGDSPSDRSDPLSPDRQLSSLLDWCDTQPGIDSRNICLWGFSTGGFYAIRAAHTHRRRLKGVISLGGGCHHMFDREWLDEVNHLEYPFDLASSLSHKFGYPPTPTGFADFKNQASQKFSLLNDGTLEKPCTRLLLVNGTQDEIFPIEDLNLLLHVGPTPKEARFITGRKHMGEPESFAVCLRWIYGLFGLVDKAGRVEEDDEEVVVEKMVMRQLKGLRREVKFPAVEGSVEKQGREQMAADQVEEVQQEEHEMRQEVMMSQEKSTENFKAGKPEQNPVVDDKTDTSLMAGGPTVMLRDENARVGKGGFTRTTVSEILPPPLGGA